MNSFSAAKKSAETLPKAENCREGGMQMGNRTQDNENTGWKKTTDSEAQERRLLDDMIELADAPEETESAPKAAENAEERDLADRAEDALRDLGRELFSEKLPAAGKKLCAASKRAFYAMGDFFYEVGFYTEYALVKCGRVLKKAAVAAAGLLWKALLLVLRVVLWLPAAVVSPVVKPFWYLLHSFKGV
jgi:hypothetical protein